MKKKRRYFIATLLVTFSLIVLTGVGYSAKPVTGDSYTLDDIYNKLIELASNLSIIDTKLSGYSSDFSLINSELNGLKSSINNIGINIENKFDKTFLGLDEIKNGIIGIDTKLNSITAFDPSDVDGIPNPLNCQILFANDVNKPIVLDEIFELRIILKNSDLNAVTNLEPDDFYITAGEILSISQPNLDGHYYINVRITEPGMQLFQVYVSRVLINDAIVLTVVDKSIPNPLYCMVVQESTNVLPYVPEPLSNIFVLRAEIKNSEGQAIQNLTADDFVLTAGDVLQVIEYNPDYFSSYYLITASFEKPGCYELQLFANKTLVRDRIIVVCPDLSLPSAELSSIIDMPYNSVITAGVPFEFEVIIVNSLGVPIENLQAKDFKISKGEILAARPVETYDSGSTFLGHYRIEARFNELGQYELFFYVDYVKLNEFILLNIISAE